MSIDHDALFKQLLTAFFKDFLELFAPSTLQYGQPETISFTDKEVFWDLPGMERREPDLVAQVKFQNGLETFFLIHVEVQSQVEPQFNRRMFSYFARLHEAHNAKVYPIAIFAHDAVNRDEPNTYEISFPDIDVLRFSYTTIHLRRLDWKKYMAHENPIAAALMAKMGYDQSERAKVKAECIRLLASLKLDPERTPIIGRFIEAYLPLDEIEMSQYNEIMEAIPMGEKQAVSEILTYWEQLGLQKGLEQGLEQGLERGLEQGLERGLEQGLKQGMLQMILRQIEQRFGNIPPDDLKMIDQLSHEKLEQLGVAIIKAADYTELREYFLSENGLPNST